MSGVRVGRVPKRRRANRNKTRSAQWDGNPYDPRLIMRRTDSFTYSPRHDGTVEIWNSMETTYERSKRHTHTNMRIDEARKRLSGYCSTECRECERGRCACLLLRMMAIMQDRNSEEVPREFLETGRTGRRNAMPDILHPQGAEVTTADLPSRLQNLVTTDPDNPQPGPSKADLDPNKVDEAAAKKDCS